MDNDILLPADLVPVEGAVLNPFVIVDDAAGLLTFVSEVFAIAETVEARTPMPDGKLIHAELRLGTVNLMMVDRLDGWPSRPGLLQWLYAPPPGQPDPTPIWEGGSDVVFSTLDATLCSLA